LYSLLNDISMKKMIKKTVFLFFSLVVGSLNPAFARNSGHYTLSDKALAANIQALASFDSAVQLRSLRVLKKNSSIKLLPFFTALMEGSLHTWDDKGRARVVIVGEIEETEEDELATLLNPMTSEPILGRDGSVVKVSVYDLERVSVDTDGRALVQSALDKIKLTHGDDETRKSVAVSMGNEGDPSVLPLLEEALSKEKSKWIRHAMEQAINQIWLADSDPKVRAKAALKLGEIIGSESLPALKLLIQEDGEKDESVREAIQLAINKIANYQRMEQVVGVIF